MSFSLLLDKHGLLNLCLGSARLSCYNCLGRSLCRPRRDLHVTDDILELSVLGHVLALISALLHHLLLFTLEILQAFRDGLRKLPLQWLLLLLRHKLLLLICSLISDLTSTFIIDLCVKLLFIGSIA